ncbi:MAG: tyrosine-type recombinase/integrase [Candidatus Hodarchaeales archaeon]
MATLAEYYTELSQKDKFTVTQFLNAQRSKGTRASYATHLRNYFGFFHPHLLEVKRLEGKKREKVFKEIDKLSLEYVQRGSGYIEDLIEYRNEIEHYAPKTRVAKMAAVLSYLRFNQIHITDTHKNLLYYKNQEAISKEIIPTHEQVKKLLELLPLPERALTVTLLSSGMRAGEAIKLTLDAIDFDQHPAKIYLDAEITKTKKSRITFISDEARDLLVSWLEYRDEYSKRASAKSTEREYDPNDNRLFPFTYKNYVFVWTTAVEKIEELNKRDSRTNRLLFTPHKLRKFFRTRGNWTNSDVPEALMGHQSGLTAIYARMDQAENILREEYLRAMPNLSINKNSRVVQDLRAKVEKQSEEIQTLVTNLSLKNVSLESKIQELQLELNNINMERSRLSKKLSIVESELKTSFRLTEEDLLEIYAETLGVGGGKSRRVEVQNLKDLDEDEVNRLFIVALKKKVLQ